MSAYQMHGQGNGKVEGIVGSLVLHNSLIPIVYKQYIKQTYLKFVECQEQNQQKRALIGTCTCTSEWCSFKMRILHVYLSIYGTQYFTLFLRSMHFACDGYLPPHLSKVNTEKSAPSEGDVSKSRDWSISV